MRRIVLLSACSSLVLPALALAAAPLPMAAPKPAAPPPVVKAPAVPAKPASPAVAAHPNVPHAAPHVAPHPTASHEPKGKSGSAPQHANRTPPGKEPVSPKTRIGTAEGPREGRPAQGRPGRSGGTTVSQQSRPGNPNRQPPNVGGAVTSDRTGPGSGRPTIAGAGTGAKSFPSIVLAPNTPVPVRDGIVAALQAPSPTQVVTGNTGAVAKPSPTIALKPDTKVAVSPQANVAASRFTATAPSSGAALPGTTLTTLSNGATPSQVPNLPQNGLATGKVLSGPSLTANNAVIAQALGLPALPAVSVPVATSNWSIPTVSAATLPAGLVLTNVSSSTAIVTSVSTPIVKDPLAGTPPLTDSSTQAKLAKDLSTVTSSLMRFVGPPVNTGGMYAATGVVAMNQDDLVTQLSLKTPAQLMQIVNSPLTLPAVKDIAQNMSNLNGYVGKATVAYSSMSAKDLDQLLSQPNNGMNKLAGSIAGGILVADYHAQYQNLNYDALTTLLKQPGLTTAQTAVLQTLQSQNAPRFAPIQFTSGNGLSNCPGGAPSCSSGGGHGISLGALFGQTSPGSGTGNPTVDLIEQSVTVGVLGGALIFAGGAVVAPTLAAVIAPAVGATVATTAAGLITAAVVTPAAVGVATASSSGALLADLGSVS